MPFQPRCGLRRPRPSQGDHECASTNNRSIKGRTDSTAVWICTPGACTCASSTPPGRRCCTSYPADAGAFLAAVAPYRDGLAVTVECMFAWYWLADLCHEHGIPFVLGHALYMKAINQGKSKNDRLDAAKIAGLLRRLMSNRVPPVNSPLLTRRLQFRVLSGELETLSNLTPHGLTRDAER